MAILQSARGVIQDTVVDPAMSVHGDAARQDRE
jgi:hypothetical protein